MFTPINDRLSSQIGTTNPDKRIINYIWMYIAIAKPSYLNINLHQFDREYISEILEKEKNIKKQIANNLLTGLIFEHELGWIKNNSRQSKWIEKNIRHVCNHQFYDPTIVPEHLYGRERSIALFDFRSNNPGFNTHTKLEASENLRLLWEEQQEKDKKYDWLNTNGGESQRQCFWQTLKRRHPELISHRAFFEDHDEFLSFFIPSQFIHIRNRASGD